MAVTTTKTNIMTIIEEDGGDPTGAGGKVINDNFKKIDDLFDGDDCKSAEFSKIAGITPIGNSSSYYHTVGTTNYPIAIWGTTFESGFNGGDAYVGKIGYLPPFGPFAYIVKIVIINNSRLDDSRYLECRVLGCNSVVTRVISLGDWLFSDTHDNYINVNAGAPSYINETECSFTAISGALYCGIWGSSGGSTLSVTTYASYIDNTVLNSNGDYIGPDNTVFFGQFGDS